MIRRSTKIVFEVLAALVLTVIVVAGVGAWRLGSGPISIAAITPYIETALSDTTSGRRVIIGASSLVWDPGDHAIEVRADRVSVFDGDNKAVMVVPEMTVRFRLPALLRGVVAPRTITFVRPAVTVIRAADGGWEFSAVPDTEQGPAASTGSGLALELIERGLAELDRFRLVDARLVIDDRRAHALWVVPRVSLALDHVRDQFAVGASLELDLDGQTVPLRGSGRLDAAYNLRSAELSVADLVPAHLARRLVELQDLAALDLPLGGTVRFENAPTDGGAGPALWFDLAAGAGQLVRPELPGGALPVNHATARGTYRIAQDVLQLDAATLGLATTALTLSGSARDLTGHPAVEGNLGIASLPLDDLRKYWPAEMGANARRWILANMSQGTIRDLAVRFGFHLDGADVALDALDGTLAVDGTKLRYIKSQPLIEQVSGQIKFDPQHFDIAISGGQLRGLTINDAQLVISGLSDRQQMMTIELDNSGPVSDVLALLDLPPFGYVRRYGFAPQAITGDVAGHMSLKFPLVDRLSLDEVALRATARLTDLHVPKAVRDFDLTEGRLDLNLDKAGMGLAGEGRLGGVRANLSWTENFVRGAGAPFRRRYDVTATLTDADRKTLGLDVGDGLDGPVAATVSYTDPWAGPSTLLGQLDLAKASLKIADLGWTKPVGQAASARFDLRLVDGRFASLAAAELTGGGLSARASGTFGPAGKLARLDIQQLKVDATDVAGHVAWQGDRLDIDLAGRSLDASALLGGDDLDNKPARAMTVSARLDRVVLGRNRQIDKVDLRAESDGTKWVNAALSSAVGKGTMRLSLVPRAGGRDLSITSDDAGAVLEALDLTHDVHGGKLTVEGRYDDAESVDRLTARVGIENYRIVRAPLLARLVAAASLTGIPDFLNGDGILFQDLSLQVTKMPNRLEIAKGRASGRSLGLSVEGTITGADDVADLTGTVVPINSIQGPIESIPLLGPLVKGGVFAFAYSVKGPIDSPDVSVNPLSVLAPGFVRDLFRWLPGASFKGGTPPPSSSSGQ